MSDHDGLRPREAATDRRKPQMLAKGNYGSIKRCASGCTHITFAAISLHFSDSEQFERYAIEISNRLARVPITETFPLQHQGTTLLLDTASARAFHSLIEEGLATIRWFRGECEFSENDYQRLLGFPL